MQATCVRAIERAHTLHNDLNLQAWLIRIMRNLHFDQLRDPVTSWGPSEVEPPWKPEPLPPWRRVLDDDIERLVPRLPPRLRAVWQLVHEHKLNQGEIADRLGIPRGTVATRIFRARMMMRKLLAASGAEEPEPGWV